MNDVVLDPLPPPAALVFTCAWHTRHRARCAAGAADLIGTLADGVAALGVPETAPDVVVMRKAARAASRYAEKIAANADALDALLPAALAELGPRASDSVVARVTKPFTSRSKAAGAMLDATVDLADASARTAAGLALLHEPPGAEEPLWRLAIYAVGYRPPEDASFPPLVLTGDDRDRVALGGVVAHVAQHAPTYLVLEVEDGRGRYVQAEFTEHGAKVASVADEFLTGAGRLRAAEKKALAALGFAVGDDGPNWVCAPDSNGVGCITELLLATLRDVHGAGTGTVVSVSATRTPYHPDVDPDLDDPANLTPEPTRNIPAIAESLAGRVRDWIDTVGLDRLWVTVEQPGSPYFAHIGPDADGALFTEVAGDFYLDPADRLEDERKARLRALGWADPVDDPSDDDEIQPRNHTRVWPAPFDLDTACWLVVLTLASVYGFDPDLPVQARIEPFA